MKIDDSNIVRHVLSITKPTFFTNHLKLANCGNPVPQKLGNTFVPKLGFKKWWSWAGEGVAITTIAAIVFVNESLKIRTIPASDLLMTPDRPPIAKAQIQFQKKLEGYLFVSF
jgi:hypothetical protein